MDMAKRVELLVGERNPRESRKAMIACNDFLRMGPGRTLVSLFQVYSQTPENAATKSKNTLGDWSKRYNWQARAELYDAEMDARKTEEAERRRVEILNSGFALDYERVMALKEIADLLLTDIREQVDVESVGDNPPVSTRPNVWLADVKQIGGGEDAERVDIVRFNAALFEQFRAALEDIAKETGGRINKTEITGKDGGSIPILITKMDIDEL